MDNEKLAFHHFQIVGFTKVRRKFVTSRGCTPDQDSTVIAPVLQARKWIQDWTKQSRGDCLLMNTQLRDSTM